MIRIILPCILLYIIPSFAAKEIVCNDQSCLYSGTDSYRSTDKFTTINILGNTEDLNISSGEGDTTKKLILKSENAVSGPSGLSTVNVNADLSGNKSGKTGGDLVLIGNMFAGLNIKIDGYMGKNGRNASQICADNARSGLYGAVVQDAFIQRREVNPSIPNRCDEIDYRLISDQNFSCSDSAFTVLPLNQSVNIEKVRDVSKCQTSLTQNVCFQKSYKLTCNYKLSMKVNIGSGEQWHMWDTVADWVWLRGSLPETQQHRCTDGKPIHRAYSVFLKGYSGEDYVFGVQHNQHTGRRDWYRRLWYSVHDGTAEQILQSRFPTRREMDIQKEYIVSDEKLNQIRSTGIDPCSVLIEEDDDLSISKNPNFTFVGRSNRHRSFNDCNGWGSCTQKCHGNGSNNVTVYSNNLRWAVTSKSDLIESTPGRDNSNTRLVNGSVFQRLPNKALQQTNPSGWKIQLMPAFSQAQCNPDFNYITQESTTIQTLLFDSTLNKNTSFYCVNKSNPLNCSNPPYCDNPNDPSNCRQVNYCQTLNKSSCIDPSNPVNCSSPPFCDDPNDPSNCKVVKACDPSDPNSQSCLRDPDNLSSYQFSGTTPDPSGITENIPCEYGNCPIKTETKEVQYSNLEIKPTNGENGSAAGKAFVFINDVQLKNLSSMSGIGGLAGENDLEFPEEDRFCYQKRDNSTDPSTEYSISPILRFLKIKYKGINVKGGGLPGIQPHYDETGVFLFKKIDPALRHYLYEELSR